MKSINSYFVLAFLVLGFFPYSVFARPMAQTCCTSNGIPCTFLPKAIEEGSDCQCPGLGWGQACLYSKPELNNISQSRSGRGEKKIDNVGLGVVMLESDYIKFRDLCTAGELKGELDFSQANVVIEKGTNCSILSYKNCTVCMQNYSTANKRQLISNFQIESNTKMVLSLSKGKEYKNLVEVTCQKPKNDLIGCWELAASLQTAKVRFKPLKGKEEIIEKVEDQSQPAPVRRGVATENKLEEI